VLATETPRLFRFICVRPAWDTLNLGFL